jgi:hypothetical protein
MAGIWRIARIACVSVCHECVIMYDRTRVACQKDSM